MKKDYLLLLVIFFLSAVLVFYGCSTVKRKGFSPQQEMICDEKNDEALKDQNYEKSIILHEFFIKENPENGLAMYHLGYSHGQLGDHENEVKYYEEAIRLGYYGSGIFFNLGMAYGEMERYDDAFRIFKNAIKVEPERADNHFGLALILQKMGNTLKAEREFIRAAELAPEDVDTLYYLGMLYAETGRMKKANKQLKKLMKIAPDNEMTHELRDILDKKIEDNTSN